MNTAVYYELLGRMIEAYNQAPNDDNPLTAIQMFARIATDYIEGRRSLQLQEFGNCMGALPDITGGTGSVDTSDESDECEETDPLAQIEAPEIVPVSDVEVEHLKHNQSNQDKESNQMGGGMTAKPNAISAAALDIQLSQRERELLGLMREHPEMKAKDYAEILDMSIGTVYALQSSMRKKKALTTPKKAHNG